MKKTSLQDIAAKLNVSKTLVSMVLNGRADEQRISPETVKRVRQAAREMNYKPNQMARSLRTGKSHTIGLIVADIANPFFGRLARAVEDEASRHGYHVVFSSSDERADKSAELIRLLLDRQVDGLIITPTENSYQQILDLKKTQIPFVLVDRYFPRIATNNVVLDNFKAAHQAVSRLLEASYGRIGMITASQSLNHMKERIGGYRQALKEHGIRFDSNLVYNVDHADYKNDVRQGVRTLLSPPRRVEAIFFATGMLAVAGLAAIQELNLRIPLDVAVFAFDDFDAYRLHYPGISGIPQPVEDMGKTAMQILLGEIEKRGHKTEKRHRVFEANLVLRPSSGVFNPLNRI